MKECEEFDSGMSVPEEAVLAMFEVLMGSDETTPVCARFALLDESSKTEFRAALAAAAPIICAAERKKIADEIIEITGGDTGPRSGGYYMVSMRDIVRVFKTEGSKDS